MKPLPALFLLLQSLSLAAAPSLAPSQVSAPATVQPGTSATVIWTVANNGDSDAQAPWRDRLYLSANSTLETGADRFLGDATRATPVPAKSTYQASFAFTVPNLPAGKYHLLILADRDDAVKESNESDNLGIQSVEILVPDLASVSIEAPGTASAGESLVVRWKVTNKGSGAALGSWHDRVYFSTDPTGNSADRYLGQTPWTGPLPSSGSYESSLAFTVPNVAPGNYFLVLLVDTYDTVYEIAATNNTLSSAIEVRVPDLAGVDLDAPSIVFAGQGILIAWEAGNLGNAPAPPSWYDRVYLSTDTTGNSADHYLGQTIWTNAVPPGKNYESQLAATIPNIRPGKYFLVLRIDTYDNVFESAETNNTLSRAIEVRVPDLEPVKLEAPAFVDAGEPIEIRWEAHNLGNTGARGQWHDRVYLSKDTYGDSSDRYLGQTLWTNTVPPEGSYASALAASIPNLAPGKYYLVLQIDHYDNLFETAETNNTLARPIEVRVPDLETIALEGPSFADAGESIEILWEAQNVGNTVALPPWHDRIYLSKDIAGSSADRYLGQTLWTNPVPAGSNYTSQLATAIPDVAPGNYYLVLLLDRYDNLFESAETNNSLARPMEIRVPDLAPVRMILPANIIAGKEFQLSWTVTNLGLAQARAPWTDRWYLSKDENLDGADSFLVQLQHTNNLPALGSYTALTKATISEAKLAGKQYLLLEADHYSDVFEITETNNVRSRGVQMGPEPPVQLSSLKTASASSARLPEISMLGIGTNVDRVEFKIGDMVLGTAYGEPFTLRSESVSASGMEAMLAGAAAISAAGYSVSGDFMMSAEGRPQESREGFRTCVEIEQPSWLSILANDDGFSPSNRVLVRVSGYYEMRRVVYSETGHGSGQTVRVPLSGGDFRIKFFLDGALVHTSSNGLPSEPIYHEYELETGGLAIGTHRITARLEHIEGFWDAHDTRSFEVEVRRADLRVTRTATQRTNHFLVVLTVHNDGAASATLRSLRETMTGFQPCAVNTGAIAVDGTSAGFSFTDKRGTVDIDFGGSARVLAGSYITVSYKAVPIMFQTDSEYLFGGAGFIEYRDGTGATVTEEVRGTTTFTSPDATRRAMADAVSDCFSRSDYLLVTSPLNLLRAFEQDGADSVLVRTAELAVRRNGVLGYFHTSGMIRSLFRPQDLLALGDIFTGGATADEIYVGSIDNDLVYCYGATKELTLNAEGQLPLRMDLRPGDQIAIGNLRPRYESLTNAHSRDEIVIARGDAHPASSRGRITVHQYDYSSDGLFASNNLSISGFATGDRLVAAEIWLEDDDDREELVVVRSDGTAIAYGAPGAWTLASHVSFAAGDLLAAGNLLADSSAELVIGNIGGGLRVYGANEYDDGWGWPFYAQLYEVSLVENLEEGDGLAVGDVTGDDRAEIVVAYASRDEIRIYSYDATTGDFERIGRFDVDFDSTDRLAVGYFGNSDKEQIVIAHGAEVTDRQAGTIEAHSYFGGLPPGSAHSLDQLIDRDGAWASRMASNWVSEGYLLIVGETEIVPTFSKHFHVESWDSHGSGRVDYTDRNYGSTDSSSDNNSPELSVGRIPGNSAERIVRALDTAIELADAPWHLRTGRAYLMSGSDETQSDAFYPLRQSIAERLSDRGFTTFQQHTPTVDEFLTNATAADVIFLAAHGNPWGCGGIGSDDIQSCFDPGLQRPLVFAWSCLTGRYPVGTTFGEEFLWRGAAAYIGATEVAWGYTLDGRGWCPRLTEAFFSRLEEGRPIGRSLSLAKRHRLTGRANTYRSDWDKNRFACAIYHLLGDPKTIIQWDTPPGSAALLALPAEPDEVIPGPLSEYRMAIAPFEVRTEDNRQYVTIPGQELLFQPGRPALPYCASTIRFPIGAIVQNVTLVERGGLQTGKGWVIPAEEERIPGFGPATARQRVGAGWWPDQDFGWSITKNVDGTSDLVIRAYPFQYDSQTTESRFYKTFDFAIAWQPSAVRILGFSTEKTVCLPGETAKANLLVLNTNQQPMDVTARARVLVDDLATGLELPLRAMTALSGRGWCQFRWDVAAEHFGDHAFEVEILGPNGAVLDRARAEFEVGGASAALMRLAADPPDFEAGQPVKFAATLENTGTTALEGDIVFLVQDPAGKTAAELRGSFAKLAPEAQTCVEASWSEATIPARACQVVVFAQFGGQTSAMLVAPLWQTAPLRWQSIAVAQGSVLLRWIPTPGRTYAIEFTPELGKPFSVVASGLAATPPANTFAAPAAASSGFFRLREE